jgi:hypothetical protein
MLLSSWLDSLQLLVNRGSAKRVQVKRRSGLVRGTPELVEERVMLSAAPVLDLNGTSVAGNDFSATFVENSAAIPITDSNATLTDVDSPTLASMTFVVHGAADGANEVINVAGISFPLNVDQTSTGAVGTTTFHIDYIAASGTFNIAETAGSALIGDFESLLRGATYSDAGDNPTAGDRTFDITANDGVNDSATQVSTITVQAVNDAPVLTTPAAINLADTAAADSFSATSATLSATDPDSAVTYGIAGGTVASGISTLVGTYGTLAVNVTTGDYTFTPDNAAINGLITGTSANFSVFATDGTLTDTKSLAVNITATDDSPIAQAQSVSANEDIPQAGSVVATDADTAPASVTYSIVTGPAHGTLSSFNAATGAFTYSSSSNYNGPDSFTFQANDGTLTGNTATVIIGVANVNDAPSGTDGTVTTNENSQYTLLTSDFGFTDPIDAASLHGSDNLLAVTITTLPGSGTIQLNGVNVTAGASIPVASIVAGNLKYVSASNFNGLTSFTFQVQDDGGTANSGVDLDPTANTLSVYVGSNATTLTAGNLTISDIHASGEDNQLTATRVGSSLSLTDPSSVFGSAPAGATLSNNNHTLTIPLALVTTLTFNGGAGNDTFTADFTGGSPLPSGGLTFNGGAGGFDTLVTHGGTFTNGTYTPSGVGAGTLQYDNLPAIKFSGLEPVTDDNVITNYTVNGTAANDAITIADNLGGRTKVSEASNNFESMEFSNKTNVIVNGLAGTDTITLGTNSFLAINLTTLKVDAGDSGVGPDTININGDLNLTTQVLTFIAGTIDVASGTTVATQLNQNYVGHLILEDGSVLDTTGGAGSVVLSGNVAVTGNGATINGQLDLNGATRTFAVPLAATLDINATVINSTGTAGVTVTGAGDLNLTAANTYNGATTVNGGTLAVTGSLAAASAVSVNSTGNLAGSGTISGSVTVNSGGKIEPGTDGTIGTLTVGSLSFNGGTYKADVLGNTSDTISTSGSVNLANASAGTFSLNVLGGTTTVSNIFTLINNTGAGAISNPGLTNAAESSATTVNGLSAHYTYDGGIAGNDFILRADGGATYTGTNAAETFVLKRHTVGGVDNVQLVYGATVTQSGATFTVVGGSIVDEFPLSSLTSAYTINAQGGNDVLLIDDSGTGLGTKDVSFNGGGGADTLDINGGTFGQTAYSYANATDGTIQNYSDAAGTLLSSTITYTGLSPIVNTGTATNVVFNLPATATNAILEDNGTVGDTLNRFRSSPVNFEQTDFVTPTGSLTINRGTATDTLVTNALPDFHASLTIGTPANPFALISVNNALSLGTAATHGDLALSGTAISLGANLSTDAGATAGNVTLTGAVALTANVTIDSDSTTADGNVVIAGTVTGSAANNFTVTSGSGDVTLSGDLSGIGVLQVTGNNISAQGIATTGNITVTGQNAVTLNGAVNATAATISISANSDGAGAQSFSMAAGSSIATTNNTTSAIAVTVGGTGNAAIRGVSAGTTTGRVTITAGGSITDADASATNNITASASALQAGGAIGSAADPIETTISNLAAQSGAGGGVFVTNTGALTVATVGALSGVVTNGASTVLKSDSSITLSQALNAGAGDARLVAGSTVTQSSTGVITANNFGVNAGGAVTLTTATTNDVNNLAVSTTGSIEFSDNDDLTIATVAASGAFAAASGLSSGAADINLKTGTTLAVKQVINAGTGNVRLKVGTSISQNAAGVITADQLGVQAATTVGLAGATSDVNTLAVGTTGTVEFSDSDDLIIGTVATGGSAGFTGATGITSAGNDVQVLTGTTLALNNAVNAGAGDLRLNAGGAVTQSAAITANGLALTGFGPYTLTLATNNVNTIAANIDAGAIGTTSASYVDANALAVGVVTVNTATAALNTTTTGISTSGDDVRLAAATSGITISNIINLSTGGAGGSGGNLDLFSQTGATQAAGANILANSLLLRGTGLSIGSDNFDLPNTGNNVATVAANLTNGAVTYDDKDNLTVGVASVTAGGSTTSATGITLGNPGSMAPTGGDVFLRAGQSDPTGQLVVSNNIDTSAGTGGNLLVGGGVSTSANFILGSGDIDLAGGASFPDIVVSTDTSITLSGGTATFQPNRDIIVRALLQTVNGGLTLNADANNDGVGGVWVDESAATDAQINAAGNLLIQGSDVSATGAAIDSVRVDTDTTPGNDQVVASGTLSILGKAAGGASADILLNGVARTSGSGLVTVTANHSVLLTSQVTSTTGSIAITGTTGDVDVTDSGLAGAEILANGAATITVNANGKTDLGANVTVQSAGGDVIFNTNDFVANTSTAAVTASASGIVTIRNSSAGRTIDLGTDTAGTLGITDAELDLVTAQAIRIGRRDVGFASGNLTVSAGPIDAANSSILHLISGDQVLESSGFITETNLAVEATNSITLGSSSNDVATLALQTYGAGANSSYVDANGFVIASVDGVNGINVIGTTTLTSGGNVTESAPIVSNNLLLLGLGNYDLNGAGNDINTLAANVTNRVLFTDVDDVTVGTVGATVGTSSSLLTLSAATVIVNQPITATTSGGVVLDVTTLLDINGNTTGLPAGGTAIISSVGPVSQTGTGSVDLQGKIATTNSNVSFNSAVRLTGTTAIDTGSGIGDINFSNTVNGSTVGAENLTLSSGTGDIVFGGQVGSPTRVGVVTINTARNVTTNVGFSAASVKQAAGTGSTTVNGFLNTNTVAGIDLTSNYITFNGVITTTANGTVKINNASDFQLVPGAGAISSDGAVTQTGSGLSLIGGNIVTTDDAISFASDVYISNTPITISAVTGNVTFAKLLQVNNKTLTLRDGNGVDLGTRTTIANGTLNVFVGASSTVGSLNTASGALFTGAGTVNATLNVASGATLAPASATTLLDTGILTFNANVNLASGSVFAVDLNSATAGTGYDQVVISGSNTMNVTAGAVLQASRNGAFSPPVSTALKIVDGNLTNVSGNFTGATNGTTLYLNGAYFTVSYNSPTGDIVLTSATAPGGTAAIIDNDEATGSIYSAASNNGSLTFTGSWTLNTVAGRGFTNDLRFAASTTNPAGTAFATYTFNLAPNTIYRVSTTWFELSNRASNATFTLATTGTGGSSSVLSTFNQRNAPSSFTANGAKWQDLSTAFTTGSTGVMTITLNNYADGYVIADAVRVEAQTAAGPEVQVLNTSAGNADLANNTGTVDFGSTIQSADTSGDVTKTITIKNVGSTALILGSATLTAPAGFQISGYAPTSLAAGASLPITIKMLSANVGNFSGSVSFQTNDADENPFTFNLAGSVLSNKVWVIDNPSSASGTITTTSAQVIGPVLTTATYGETGTWTNNTDQSVGFLQDLRSAPAGATATATWTFGGLTAGTYRVSVTYRAESNRASNSLFTVNGGTATPVTVNQQNSPSDLLSSGVYWKDLATSYVISGSTLSVTLNAAGTNGYVIADAVRIERISPLQAAGGPAPDQSSDILSSEDLQQTATAAEARWLATGLNDAQQSVLKSLVFQVSNLPGAYLGGETTGSILVDANAAGYGWYVDPTPDDDSEFAEVSGSSDLTAADSNAATHIDLLTVLMHEIGHSLGLDDIPVGATDNSLMTEAINVGTRRLPESDVAIAPSDDSGSSGDAVDGQTTDQIFYTFNNAGSSGQFGGGVIQTGGVAEKSHRNHEAKHHGSGHEDSGSSETHHRGHRAKSNDGSETAGVLTRVFGRLFGRGK